jgi:hypothetical protein
MQKLQMEDGNMRTATSLEQRRPLQHPQPLLGASDCNAGEGCLYRVMLWQKGHRTLVAVGHGCASILVKGPAVSAL